MAWEGITEEDFAQSYQLSILLNRNQTIEVDLAPSIPTGGSVEDAFNAFMYMQGTNTVKPKLTYSKLSYDSSSYPIGSKVCDSDGNFQYYKYFSTAQDVDLNLNLSGSLAKATYDNIQKVNFHQDPEDVILYNGRAYCGDDDIVLCESDLLSRNAHFTYYGKDYLDRVSTMAVFIDHVELYRDGGTDEFPVINGSFDANGDFVSEEGDEYIANRLNGDYPESMFKPERDAEGAVHQYVLRVYYTMRPRAYAIPAGGSQARQDLRHHRYQGLQRPDAGAAELPLCQGRQYRRTPDVRQRCHAAKLCGYPHGRRPGHDQVR